MIAAAALLFAGALFSIASNTADTTLQVAYDQTLTIPAQGATAAYAIDSSIAEATIAGDTVRVRGVAAGTTAIVIVTPSSVTTVRVSVGEPPLILPPGFRRGIGGSAAQRGSAELRYVSDPAEVAATIDAERVETDRTQRFRIVTAKPIRSNGAAAAAIPFLSYQLITPRRDVTLFDQSVMNSPLTLNGEYVRGLHVRQGPWSFHGGVTSVALFQSAFFTTEPEYVAGVTREFRLTRDQTLAANAYAFMNPPEERAVAANGAVLSLLHTYRSPVRNLLLRSEVGVSRDAIAGAAQVSREEPGLHFAANLRYEPPRFPGLAIANLHGLFADADLMRARTELTTISATAILSDYRLQASHQTNIGASTTVSHKITPHVAAVTGAIYSSFRSGAEGFDVTTFAIPVGFDAAWKRAYFSVRDQPTTDFQGRIANGYSANAGTTLGHFSVSGFYRHDVDLPTVTTFFSAVPGLQEALERSGIFVANPAQLFALLRDVGLLQRLGFTTPLDLRFAPARNDRGGNIDWFGAHQRLTLSVFRSNTQLVNSEFRLGTTSLAYTRQLASGAEIAAFTTWGGSVGERDRPIFGLLVREPFASLSRLLPGTRGDIAGHVFRDDEATAAYTQAAQGLAGVEVALDDSRVARTNASGYYAFRNVSSGIHRVEVQMPTTERFFLTTDSPAYSDVNKTVDFGVSFVRGAVFGVVANDAGDRIAGVRVDLTGDSARRSAVTDADGEFRFNGVPDGTYVVSTSAESYPTGYDLSSLPQGRVAVSAAQPVSVNLVAKALRSIAGTITTLDDELHQEVPAAGASVTIRELGETVIANAAGKYLFRRVPAGTYTIVAKARGNERSERVTVPGEPGSIVAEKLMLIAGAVAQVAENVVPETRPAAPETAPVTPPVALPAPPPSPAPSPEPVRGGDVAEAVRLVEGEEFRDALPLFERSGTLTSQDRYFYAVALYETGRYAAAKREFSASQPPDTEEARRYAAKISGAIAWTE